ncbi:1-phosphofructokinase [Mycolicibacterium chitae]|uniref:1-phosphofructokinase n=1 Tax=Mycolicibacterium chitae TaxID=1792 RepID=A0A448ICS2_MYCCI|nr:1-phosphofructokinase [Mycolicibacterium chitae]MCV7109225.1 1-phosphofructokinase [Mycolicibacterium chitae]BBZ01402.1 1-phosphofructokinase [Mycolicibacterium chitae]VEG50239.1 1-phosphofructokinase [Mycolicibacterium chitae]
MKPRNPVVVTVTPNPSIDRTIALGGPLTRGAVHRVQSVSDEPGGKGVNVARVLTLAGIDACAVLPARSDDPFLSVLSPTGVGYSAVPVTGTVRTNIAVTENDGTTTKLNEPGAELDAASIAALTDAVVGQAAGAHWVVMSGSLPPGVPDDWYAEVVALLRELPCKVAVDTSEGPLAALAAGFERAAPDLIKPNSEELASLSGADPAALEQSVQQGDPEPVVAAATALMDRGVGAVLATLGAAGAVLINGTGAWMAAAPPITPRSTVGAGDSSLAGYVRAAIGGAEEPRRLQMAVAYGSAAAALPGSALPSPRQIDLDAVQVVSIAPDR